jgi:hypothetical protein
LLNPGVSVLKIFSGETSDRMASGRLAGTAHGRHLRLSPDWRIWALAVVIVLIDIVWLQLSPLTIDPRHLVLWFAIGMALMGWWCAGYFVRLEDGPRLFASTFAFIWLTREVTAIFGQLVMSVPVPLADSLLADMDRALHLDWVGYLAWVAAKPWLAQFLLWIYNALVPVSLVAFVILHALGRNDRVSEYLALSFVGVIIAMVVGTAFPAIGAVTYFEAQALMASFPPQTGAVWIPRLMDIRSGATVDIKELVGLVSFPSYHVALTMIIAWCFRGFRVAFPIFASFALATAAATPIIGGHYFVDLLGGAAMVCIMIAVSKSRRAPNPAAPSAVPDKSPAQ